MTGVAELAAGVFLGVHLWETLRFGDVFGMAANAKVRDVGFLWSHAGRIVGMLGQRAVAGLAVDVGMDTFRFRISNIRVTALAGLVTGEGDGTRGNLREGVTPIVAVAPETFGNESTAKGEEQDEADEENGSHAKEVRDIFERNHRFSGPTGIFRTFVL